MDHGVHPTRLKQRGRHKIYVVLDVWQKAPIGSGIRQLGSSRTELGG
jgi:hypothetical protein